MYLIVTSDDLCPETMQKFKDYWDKLKEKHPKLMLTIYVPAKYNDKEINDVAANKEFYNFYLERQEWLDIEIHGLNHMHPPEFLQSKDRQETTLIKSIRMLEPYLKDKSCLGFKPSFYRYSQDTLELLQELGFRWASFWWYFIPLVPIKRPTPVFQEIPTHTSFPGVDNPDDIAKIYDKLDKTLLEFESKGWGYLTFRELIKMVT